MQPKGIIVTIRTGGEELLRQRSLQERAPEPMYQQWEREQERVRDPRQGG